MKQYLDFILIDKKPKTSVYRVVSKNSVSRPLSGVLLRHNELGTIKWYGPWRQYVFEPFQDTIWNLGCLQQVQDFIKKLMEERKKK